MMQFRLHIDIPLGGDEEQAIKDAEYYINFCFSDTDAKEKLVNNFKIDRSRIILIKQRMDM